MANDDQVNDDTQDEVTVGASTVPDFEEPAIDELMDEDEDEDTPEDILNSGQYFDDISDDSVRLHLREIGKIPLLNAEEELTLANSVVANRDELLGVVEQIAEIDAAVKGKVGDDAILPKAAREEREKLKAKAVKLSRPKDKMAEANKAFAHYRF